MWGLCPRPGVEPQHPVLIPPSQKPDFASASRLQNRAIKFTLTPREFDCAISAARRAAEIAQSCVPRVARDTTLRIRRIHVNSSDYSYTKTIKGAATATPQEI
jgi:hypothetical protein